MKPLATWKVDYDDGTELLQYQNGLDGKETPYKTINWSNVTKLTLESNVVRQEFEVHKSLPHRLSLRLRRFLRFDGTETHCFILCCSGALPPTEENLVWAMYWFPTGKTHFCKLFNCPEAATYGSGLLGGTERTLSFEHPQAKI